MKQHKMIQRFKSWSLPTKVSIVIGLLGLILAVVLPHKSIINTTTTGHNSPAITNTGSNNQIKVVYNLDEFNNDLPSYELHYEIMKTPPNKEGANNYYELGFKNITKKPLLNFTFVLYFEEPIKGIKYDFSRSTANMTGGKGLSSDKKSFHWFGNQIMEDGGWVVFIIETNNAIPAIKHVCTKYTGLKMPEKKIILSDTIGLISFKK